MFSHAVCIVQCFTAKNFSSKKFEKVLEAFNFYAYFDLHIAFATLLFLCDNFFSVLSNQLIAGL